MKNFKIHIASQNDLLWDRNVALSDRIYFWDFKQVLQKHAAARRLNKKNLFYE